MNEDKPIDAEVVPNQAVAVRPPSALGTISDMEHSFALAVRQRELLADYIRKQLKPNQHYYEVKGSNKKSLTKEGAEIILLPHNLAPDYELVSGPESPPDGDQPYQITVKCTLRRKGDPDSFVGSGIGSAGSQHRNREGKYLPRQFDRFLCHNATLKMAQKSAMIAATINSTAASEFFTQNMEPENDPGQAGTHPPPSSRPPANKTPPGAAQGPSPAMKLATDKTKAWFIGEITKSGDSDRQVATKYCIELGWLLPNETLEDMELRFVPISQKQLESFRQCMELWMKYCTANNPYLPNPEADVPRGTLEQKKPVEVPREDVDEPGDEDAWRTFPMPWGKNAGVNLEDLEKNYLYGLWANYTVETEYKGKPKKPETIEKDQAFRAMLDLAGKHYEFKKD